jgi:hypothetical protein
MSGARPRAGAHLRRAAAFAGCLAASGWAAPAAPAVDGLRFERAFSDEGEPAALHYAVRYTVGDQPHLLEVWRDGEGRLRRRTDDTIDTFVQRPAAGGEFTMTIVDNAKRLSTRIDRANLYRLGNFTDWFDLAHGLRHPLTGYLLRKVEAPGGAPAPIVDCRWYSLVQAGHSTQVCWSDRDRLPLVIMDGSGHSRWVVTSIESDPLPAHIFEIHDIGFVHNDANQDIERD